MSNATLVNFASGETSPRSRGRFDLSWYLSSCRKLLNFIPEVQGDARFRTGTRFRAETRGGGLTRKIPFQLNDSQAYMLEFTAGMMRVYKDESLMIESTASVTAITKASPAVLSMDAVGTFVNGDEIILSGISGMSELNGRQVKLSGSAGLTFQLLDPTTGLAIDSSNFTTYVSGGVASKIYEVSAPYLEAELDDLNDAQSRDTMYLANLRYAPYKLQVDSEELFTLATYTRTTDPFFAADPVLTVTGVTRAAKAVVTVASGSKVNVNAEYLFAGVVGMGQINGGTYLLVKKSGRQYYIKTIGGDDVDSSAWFAYVSGGTATPVVDNPIAVAFYESRLGFFGTNQRPNTFFLSRGPDDNGVPRYDDFTGGTKADDACFFGLAPVGGEVDVIAWAQGTIQHLIIGTFGGPFRISGGGIDQAITPSDIDIKQIDSFGCEAAPPTVGNRIFYIQRGGVTARSIRYDLATQDLVSDDACINADHISGPGFRRIVLQTGRPNVIYGLRTDGVLSAMTTLKSENVTGWFRIEIGGTDAKVVDIAVLPRPDANDQVWLTVERTINGVTRRSTEILADEVVFPDSEDFYTGPGNEDADTERYFNAVYRLQERYIHLDMAGTYNGSDAGAAASATLTPGAVTGTGVPFTASADVFTTADVGKEIWKKPNADTGEGEGRATITAFVDAQEVQCTVLIDFDSADAIDAGEWHLATSAISGLGFLEGERVAVVVDGAVYSDGRDGTKYPAVVVQGGQITLTDPAAVVHVGLPYNGLYESQNLEMGGRSGPAQDKPRNICQMFIRFLASLGCEYGTHLYDMTPITQQASDGGMDRPPPVFSGIREFTHLDSWDQETEKKVFVTQRLPLPAAIQYLDIHYDTTDEG